MVKAGARVGAFELLQRIFCDKSAVLAYFNHIGGNAHGNARVSRLNHNAAVARNSRLDTRCNNRAFGFHKRNRLTLHVRAHKRAVGIVVFKEGNKRRRYRNKLFGRNVHIVHSLGRVLRNQIAVAATYVRIDEMIILVKRLVCLRYDISVLFVRGKVIHLIGYAGFDNFTLAVVNVLNLSVRAHDKAVLVHLGIGRKRGNKSYILTFGRLYGTQSAVMRVVNVAHLEGSSVAVKSAGAERGKLALMRQLCCGVGLVHELRKL